MSLLSLAYVSVPFIGVHDLGGTKWSCQHCIGPALKKVLFSLTFRGHLLLAVALRLRGFFLGL
jgi:hypothetical protein